MRKQLATIACLLVLAACFARDRSDDPEACKENISQMASALEMYASDAAGCYPLTLQALVPRYLPALPRCPAGGSYGNYARGEMPDTYRFECLERGHRRLHFHYDVSHRIDCTSEGPDAL